MKKLNTVIKNELFRYFTSPLAYVYLISFLLLNGSFAFYFGDFFSRGQSNLNSMFAFQPWLYLIFIPGIAMRLWAEEFRNKTIIQIITTPISIATLVWGKFFAAWIFSGIALALTFPFWLTVNYLGTPDNSVILVAYLASFFLAGCILAISATMSALTKNQVIALVLSIFANIIFFLSGLDFVLNIFRVFAPISIIDMIASFSFITHFTTMTKGLIELRDIVFFLSIIILFNFTTILIVSFKTSGTSKFFNSNNQKYYYICFIFILLGFIGINLIANSTLRNIQYDATEEKLFTLSPSTIKVLDELPNDVIIKFYYSPVLGERSNEIRLMFDRIRILLNKYVSHSNGKIDYKIYNPKFLDRIEDEAISNNIQPIPVIDINQNGFFGMSFIDEIDNKNSIPFFTMERSNFVEQDITQKIYELYHKKKKVGILTTLQMGDTQISEEIVSTKWNIIDKIQELYDVEFIDSPEQIENLDVLMIVHPQKLSDEMVKSIKKYSRSCGKFFIALDGATESSRLYSMVNKNFTKSNLSGLEEFWGFKVYTDWVVADLDNSIIVDSTLNYETNPQFSQDIIQLKYGNSSFNPNLDEVSGLQSLMFSSVSPIVPTGKKKIIFVPMIMASQNSQLMPMQVVYDNISPNELLKYFEPDENSKILAARIFGEEIENPFELIVVGDTDFMYDTFWGKTTQILNQQFFIPLIDNANFVMNSLDTLTQDTNLIELRGRTAKFRKFEDIEKKRRQSQQEFAVKEAEIFDQINQAKADLEEITNKKNFENRENFNSDELALLSKIREKLDSLRLELSEIRLANSNNLKAMENYLKFINIYSIPLLIILGILINSFLKRKKKNFSKQKIILNKELIYIASTAIFLILIGSLTTYLTDRREIDKYEDKAVFENLSEKINDVSEIIIKNKENELTFYNEDGIWKLKNHENFAVYQERIKHFLITLMDAKFYEKKTAKAEYLDIFGLSPVEDPYSKSTSIQLLGENGKQIESFEIGNYNIDIGRGAKAAYLKFNDKFQIWLISADFVSLSTNWQEWTYSTTWNLRFGRAKDINNIESKEKNTLIMRDILNISLEKTSKDKTKEIAKLEITTEDDDKIELIFSSIGERNFISYHAKSEIKNPHLKFFYGYVKDKSYELSGGDKEKIENVTKLAK